MSGDDYQANPEAANPDMPQPIGWTWLKHVRSIYAGQKAPCGCWWSSATGTDHVGEHCERRSSRWKQAERRGSGEMGT